MKRKQPRVSLVNLVEQDQLGELFETRDLPVQVARICSETIIASNAGAFTLAGGGYEQSWRLSVSTERFQGRIFRKKIDDLVSKGLLEKPQADLLHEERYIGNAALHEILPPAKQEIENGLVNSGGADEYELYYTASPGGPSWRKATKNDENVRCS